MDPQSNDSSSSPNRAQRRARTNKKTVNNFRTREYKKEVMIDLLSKDRLVRTKNENRILSEYLSLKVAFFTKLKTPEDTPKLERLIGALNYEFYQKNSNIISFGEEGDKFYILIEGLVGIFKPSYVHKTMKLRDYLLLMNDIKEKEGNLLKYARIKEKNATAGIDFDFFSKIHPESYALKRDYTVIIEEDEKLGEFTEPFAFGDIALIKKCQRNATIKALKDCKVVTIDKYDYNKIIREIEEKRLETQLKDFRKAYPFFQYWNLNQLIRLFNCFSKVNLLQGEYLYKQNEVADCIYVIKSGEFEMYSLLSFGWLPEFFNYIIKPKQNLVFSSSDISVPMKEAELLSYYENLLRESEASPCVFNHQRVPRSVSAYYDATEELDRIRLDHEEMSNPDNVFKVNCRKITSKEVIGIEDALEMKKRFCFVRCVSKHAEVDKVNIFDFLRLMNHNRDDCNKSLLLDIIAQRKLLVFTQLKNGAIQRNKELTMKLVHRCQSITHVKPTEETKLVVMKLKDKDLFNYSNYRHDIINALTSPKKQHLKQKSKRISLIDSNSSRNVNSVHQKEILTLRNEFSMNLRRLKKGAMSSLKKELPQVGFKYAPMMCITRFNSLAHLPCCEKETMSTINVNEGDHKKHVSMTRDLENSSTKPMDSSANDMPRLKVTEKGADVIDEANELTKTLSRNNKHFFLSRNYNTSSQRVLRSNKYSF